MRRHLNDLVVRQLPLAESGQYDVWDMTLPRFGLRIGKRAKTFVLNAGKRRITIGRYPIISLGAAREEAKRRMALKYLPPTSPKAQAAVKMYFDAIGKQKRAATIGAYSVYLKRLPDHPLHLLTAHQLYAALPQSSSAANLCFSVFKAFLSWCVERDLLGSNPLLLRKQPHKRKSRDRLLTDPDIRAVWVESHHHDAFGALVRTLILTGQRLNQIASLNPAWLSDSARTISFPAHVMKSNTEHVIPLTAVTAGQLRAIHPIRDVSSPMKALREKLPNIPHWTLHDFRRYFSSTMARLKVPIDVTEALLAHTTGSRSQIQRIYDRFDRLDPMRAALEAYEAHLQRVLEPERT